MGFCPYGCDISRLRDRWHNCSKICNFRQFLAIYKSVDLVIKKYLFTSFNFWFCWQSLLFYCFWCLKFFIGKILVIHVQIVNNRAKNVIKTHFVETYQRKGWLCFMFYLFLVMMTVTLLSRVSILFQELKSSCGTFLDDPQNSEFVSTVGKRLKIETKHH